MIKGRALNITVFFFSVARFVSIHAKEFAVDAELANGGTRLFQAWH